MHLATLAARNAYSLPEGVYVLDDNNSAESLARGEAKLNEAKLNLPPLTPDRDWNGKKVLFYRSGAKGDLLFCTPTLRQIKKLWPSSEITFATMPENFGVLQNNPDIDYLVAYPMELDKLTKFDGYFIISDTIHDGNSDTHAKNAVDIILSMGDLLAWGPVDVPAPDKELRYEVTFAERSAAWARFPKGTHPRIGIQLAASIPSRTWPKSHVIEFTKIAIKEGYEVVVLAPPGATGAVQAEAPMGLILADRADPPLSLRESLALLSTCDGFVGSDSLFLHAAGAMSIPSIGLFASFPSALRVKYAASIKAIDGEPLRSGRGLQPCNPCFHSYRTFPFQLWPDGGQCNQTNRCEVLAAITPDVVLKKLVRHMRKFVHRNGVTA